MVRTGSSPFAEAIIRLIRSIPPGRVATYGQIAVMAGNPRGTRAVFWLLCSSSDCHDLPWHRVVNRHGTISLAPGRGYEEQKARLLAEGVHFDKAGRIDLGRFLWSGD